MRRQYDAAFKAKVAFEAAKGEKAIAQISSEFGVHPNQIPQWRRHLLETMPDLFSDRIKKLEQGRDELEAELYRQTGQLKVEVDWLKKNLSCFSREKEGFIRTGQSGDTDLKAMRTPEGLSLVPLLRLPAGRCLQSDVDDSD